MQSDRHERISMRAYQIWLVEGQVHGRDIEHWQQAEREVAEEEMRMAVALADRAAAAPNRTRKASAKATPAKASGNAASGKAASRKSGPASAKPKAAARTQAAKSRRPARPSAG